MIKGNNPFKEDTKLLELLRQLDGITTRRQFRRWKKSFMRTFETYLGNTGCSKVRLAYRQLSHILAHHVELVKAMHAHIQAGNLTPDGCTVRARQTLGDFFDQMIRVKQILIDLLPTTAKMEKEIGYTKFHLAAVLIDNGFIAYDRLSLCDEIHHHFKRWCLQDVTSQLFLLEMDHYHSKLGMFCDILADLGLKDALETCLTFLHLDDEETIVWNGGSTVDSLDDSFTSASSSSNEDMEPNPDLSDITFDDESTLNLPLWKVNEFYLENAEMAESFRRDLKRKSCQMFNDVSAKGSLMPPSMPRRSSDDSVQNEVLLEPNQLSLPTKPRRRLSNEGDPSMAATKKTHNIRNLSQSSGKTESTAGCTSTGGGGGDEGGRELGQGMDHPPRHQKVIFKATFFPTPVKNDNSSHSVPNENNDKDSDDSLPDALARPKGTRRPVMHREDSFYCFATYYHGNPSDWKSASKSNNKLKVEKK